MFTGIIESFGEIISIDRNGDNCTFRIQSKISKELQIDQSVSHNGICLTVVNKSNDWHDVTAIKETLELTSSNSWAVGQKINLERAAMLHSRLDGHIVQGHVDATAIITKIEDENGSWRYTLAFDSTHAPLIISKGSICIDGVSLTAINPTLTTVEVAIIPYTFEHTVFHSYLIGHAVNLEFDIIGKYILRSKSIEAYLK